MDQPQQQEEPELLHSRPQRPHPQQPQHPPQQQQPYHYAPRFRESAVPTASGSVFHVYHHGDLPCCAPPQPRAGNGGDGGTTEAEAEAEGVNPPPPPPAPQRPVLLFLHGAGQTALSFALMAAELMRLVTGGGGGAGASNSSNCSTPLILCPDLPFHGRTRSRPDDADYSRQRLVRDVLGCLAACLAGGEGYSLTLVGHSLGGALAVKLAAEPGLAALGELKGVCIVEMVEAAALENLEGMRRRVEAIPTSFDSPDAAVRWSIQAGFLRNEASAEISIPSQLRLRTPTATVASSPPCGAEEYVWIFRLLDSEAFWRGWFAGTSAAFLALPAAKLLVLANYAMLDCDRALVAGQMQGRFQTEFIAGTHNLHEDYPEAAARTLVRFLCRHQILHPPDLPPPLGFGYGLGGPGSSSAASSRGPSPCPSPSPHRPHSRSAPPSPSPSPPPTSTRVMWG